MDSAASVRLELGDALTTPVAATLVVGAPKGWMWLPWPLRTALSVVLIGALLSWAPWETTPAPLEMRSDIVTPATTEPYAFALSPDGRRIVLVATGDGPSRLWQRALSTTTAAPMPGTEGAQYPFWSPDSRSVGFFAEGKMKRVDLDGGVPQVVVTAPEGRGATWSSDGVILFTPNAFAPLFRVSAAGGPAVAVTKLDQRSSHRFPSFLPDGRRFLFYSQGTADIAGIYLGSLDSPEVQRLTEADAAGVYLSPGWLVFVRAGPLVGQFVSAGQLVAQRLDLDRRALIGDQVILADPVVFESGYGVAAVSVSGNGLVAYRTALASRRQLVWFDRSGKALGPMGAPDENNLFSPSLSPDSQRVAVARTVQGNTDIWLMDGIRSTRFTSDAAEESRPIWSPDGRWLVFRSTRKGARDLYQGSSSRIGAEELLVSSDRAMMAAPITITGSALKPGVPVTLFTTKILGGGIGGDGRQYDVAHDGRFLINTVLDESSAPITLMQHWNPTAKK